MKILNKKYVISKVSTEYTKSANILMIYENDRVVEASVLYDDEECDLNNIYVAHVNDIVKNIDGAFLEYQKGKIGYLSLKDCKNPVFINTKNTNKLCQGDNILVQLIKEPVKTKNGVLTTNIKFTGKYVVFEAGTDNGVRVSLKIKDDAYSDKITRLLMPICDDCCFIVRTEAYNASDFDVIKEAEYLKDKYLNIKKTALCRPAYTLVHKAMDVNLSVVLDTISNGDEIISDCDDILSEYKEVILPSYSDVKFKLYGDALLPLYKLYNFEGTLKEISSKIVWLNSGAYLVIEYTEAMTVIDVNTGKCIKGKGSSSTFLKINLEAAKEILRQLRLRNISGIIMCDFINMDDPSMDAELTAFLKELALKDRLKVNIVGMTKLKIMEITRKKVRDRILLKKSAKSP